MTKASLLWVRLDLRLADNPALVAAAQRGPVIPVFIWAAGEENPWAPGAASKWWLHRSLKELERSFREIGLRLVILRGPTLRALLELAKGTSADAVFWNRRCEPAVIARDKEVEQALRSEGLTAESFNAALLHEPGTVCNRSGKPFQVFTPFWNCCLAQPDPAEPVGIPRELRGPARWPKSLRLEELGLLPKINWASGLEAAWVPGESGAMANLQRFLSSGFTDYSQARNHPHRPGTARVSPHLHFGEIGPRQIWHQVRTHAARNRWPTKAWRHSQFLTEIGWREFSHHLLFHFPHTPLEPLRDDFKKFPWREDAAFLKAWQQGQTGYPIVDAGMRELWTTGWMHNRVRMIVASFLVKDLLIRWQEGARWFWDTLVDADLAQNTLGWQWTAGCGADAAPYFRVFNPVIQSQKFDSQGGYIRRWCPELAGLPDKYVHDPSKTPSEALRQAGVSLGDNYPTPIVSHTIAREVALEAFTKLKAAAV